MPSPRASAFFVACVSCLLAHGPAATSVLAGQAPEAGGKTHPRSVLVLGRVSNDPRKDYPSLKALADYLAAGLQDVGVAGSAVQFADGNDKMAALLRAGTVDVVSDTVFAAVRYEADAGAKLLLREWRDGAPSYRSVLFKRRDNPIRSLPELLGRKIAFERRGSTSAHLVPLAELQAGGLQTYELAGPDREPASDGVGYTFAGSENNVVVWVHRRLVDAGAFSDVDWEQPEDMPPALKQDLEIFHSSAPLPRALVIVRQDLPPPVEQGVKRILLTATGDPTGRVVLKGYRSVTRYDELVGEAAAGVATARRLTAVAE
jgi:phosphonate transport system substrate-binding protein